MLLDARPPTEQSNRRAETHRSALALHNHMEGRIGPQDENTILSLRYVQYDNVWRNGTCAHESGRDAESLKA